MIERAELWQGKTEFFDAGALVYYLKEIPWVVPDFSVDAYLPTIERLQEKLDRGEPLSSTEVRFLIEALKPEGPEE